MSCFIISHVMFYQLSIHFEMTFEILLWHILIVIKHFILGFSIVLPSYYFLEMKFIQLCFTIWNFSYSICLFSFKKVIFEQEVKVIGTDDFVYGTMLLILVS